MRLYEKPIAHRGLHDEESPENSMTAFQKALAAGYNIETDVHLLTDGKLAAFHDSKLRRMIPNTEKRIEELSSADLAGNEYLLPNGEHIPLFEDLVKLVDGKVDILCELKSSSVKTYFLEQEVYRVIKDKPWIKVQSFNPFSMIWFKKHAPEVIRGQLSANVPTKVGNFVAHLNGAFLMLYRVKPAFFAYNILDLPSKKVIKACKKHGMKLLAWTVKSDDLVKRAHESEVDNIIFENIKPIGYEK